jgi:hypothetical protein
MALVNYGGPGTVRALKLAALHDIDGGVREVAETTLRNLGYFPPYSPPASSTSRFVSFDSRKGSVEFCTR